MPPRHAYWTIILEGKPTAFRAHTRDELLPTLRQLQARHADTVMMWFARGRLWTSPEQERESAAMRRSSSTRRGADWRPGGAHRDPRDRFKVSRDEKRRRFAARVRRTAADRQREPGEDRRTQQPQPRTNRSGAAKRYSTRPPRAPHHKGSRRGGGGNRGGGAR